MIDEFLKELRISTRDRIISLSLALCGLLVIFFNIWTGAVLMVLGLGNLIRAWYGIYKIKLRKIEEKDQLKDKLHELENKKASLLMDKKRSEELKIEVQGLRERVQEIEKKAESIASSVPEDYRPREVKRFIEIIESPSRALENLRAEVRGLEGEISRYEAMLHRLRGELSSEERRKEELSRDIELLEEKIAKLVDSLRQLCDRLLSLKKPESEVEIPELKGRPEIALVEARELFSRYNKKPTELSTYIAKMEQRKDLMTQIRNAEEKLKRMPEIRQRIDELMGEIRGLRLDIEAYTKAIKTLDEIANERRRKFAPKVEMLMGGIISYITNGKYKAVKIDPEKYNIRVFDSDAGQFLKKDIFGGGTNDQFLLAMRIAFTLALIPTARGRHPRFLFLDEPLGSSDAERRERIVKLLANELTKHFDQIFLITHVDIDTRDISCTVIVLEYGKIRQVSGRAPKSSSQ